MVEPGGAGHVLQGPLSGGGSGGGHLLLLLLLGQEGVVLHLLLQETPLDPPDVVRNLRKYFVFNKNLTTSLLLDFLHIGGINTKYHLDEIVVITHNSCLVSDPSRLAWYWWCGGSD